MILLNQRSSIWALSLCFLFYAASTSAKEKVKPHYEGTLFEDPFFWKKNQNAENHLREIVSVDTRILGKKNYSISIKDLKKRELLKFELKKKGIRKFWLTLPLISETQIKLTKETRHTPTLFQRHNGNESGHGKPIKTFLKCYASYEHYNITLCLNPQELHLTIKKSDGSLLLRLHSGTSARNSSFEAENERDFLLSELLALARERNFDSRIEYLRTLQAWKTAQSMETNLLPHLHARSIFFMAAPFMPANFMSNLGDFAPFMIPTRWYQEKQANTKALIQEEALRIMRAQVTLQTEELVYTYLQHQKALELYKEIQEKVAWVLQRAKILEDRKALDEGVTTNLLSLASDLQRARIELELGLANDRVAISETAGFLNRNTVRNVLLDQESILVQSAQRIDENLISAYAPSQSLNNRQYEYNLKLLHQKRRESGLIIFDPSESVRDPLGVNLGFSNAASVLESGVIELLQTKNQIQVGNRSFVSAKTYNADILEFQQAAQAAEYQKTLLDKLLIDLQETPEEGKKLGLPIPMILNYIRGSLQSALEVENQRAGFRRTRAKLHHMLLLDYYKVFQTQATDIQSLKDFAIKDSR